MTIGPQNRVGMAQEILSRQLEAFKSRWQPSFDGRYAKIAGADEAEAEYFHRCDKRDFDVELTNLIQSAFMAAQAPFAAELDVYRQSALGSRLSGLDGIDKPTMTVMYSDVSALAKHGIKISGDPIVK